MKSDNTVVFHGCNNTDLEYDEKSVFITHIPRSRLTRLTVSIITWTALPRITAKGL